MYARKEVWEKIGMLLSDRGYPRKYIYLFLFRAKMCLNKIVANFYTLAPRISIQRHIIKAGLERLFKKKNTTTTKSSSIKP